MLSRRDFLRTTAAVAATSPLLGSLAQAAPGAPIAGSTLKLGLVTYLWGQDWDLKTLITNCEKSGVLGVETRTTHKHGVEPSLSPAQRAEVKKRFDDSPVCFVGPGSNERFCHTDQAALRRAIEATKAFVKLSHDCGGSGVKVKPNDLPGSVPREKTIEQIGRSLEEVGKYAAELGQEIRLEVHGKCSELPTMAAIMEHVESPAVGVCWNCNGQDLIGDGLVHNFNLVKDRFGETVHVREFNVGEYPYQQLVGLLVDMDYDGWVLLECRTRPADRIAALIEQREIFASMIQKAKAS